jgi:hypothetical protein
MMLWSKCEFYKNWLNGCRTVRKGLWNEFLAFLSISFTDVGGIKQRNFYVMPLNNVEFSKNRYSEKPCKVSDLNVICPIIYNFRPILMYFVIEDPNGVKSSSFEGREIRRSESHTLRRGLNKIIFLISTSIVRLG